MRRDYRERVAAASGLICPRCGCRDIRKVKAVPQVGGVRRYAKCRHCGWRLITFERVVRGYPRQDHKDNHRPSPRRRGVDWGAIK